MTRAAAADSLRPALVLISLVLLARIVYTVFLCPYDLVEDEAHYWLWSRHLDWSYYSKGPGIAWVIWLSTQLFGHAEWAVRLPTVIANAVGAFACAGLARDIARRAFVDDGSVALPARAAVCAAIAYLLAPAFQITGMLVTIDGCYLACWAAACWAGWRALCEASRSAWIALGLALAAGFLFKYTILLFIPGLVLFFVLNRPRLRMGACFKRGMICAAFLTLLGLAPVVTWNAREGWPTVQHLLGHLGVEGGDVPIAPSSDDKASYNPKWTMVYLAAPIGIFGPSLVLGAVAALRILNRRQATTESSGSARRLGASFLLCCAAPILIFYLVVSFIAEPEQNWAIAGFVTIMVLAGWYAADELSRRKAGGTNAALTAAPLPRTRVVKVLWRLSIIYGVCGVLFLHRADVAAAVATRAAAWSPVASVVRWYSGNEPRPIVPGRLIGAKMMAAHAGRILDELDPASAEKRARGVREQYRAVLMADHYGRASQMAYYFFRDGRDVRVYSPQSLMGGRRSQFDLWPDTSLDDPALKGRSALLLSNNKPHTVERWERLFERVEPLRSTRLDDPQKLDGEHKKDRVAYLGFGFRGVK